MRVSRRPHRALTEERCTNAVASPFGVTGALCVDLRLLSEVGTIFIAKGNLNNHYRAHSL